jgi:hypothetical protein
VCEMFTTRVRDVTRLDEKKGCMRTIRTTCFHELKWTFSGGKRVEMKEENGLQEYKRVGDTK